MRAIKAGDFTDDRVKALLARHPKACMPTPRPGTCSHSIGRDCRSRTSRARVTPKLFTPGPDVLYIVGRSLGQGRSAGVVSALGISAGCLLHVAAAALGLSALMVTLRWRTTWCDRRAPSLLFRPEVGTGASTLAAPTPRTWSWILRSDGDI